MVFYIKLGKIRAISFEFDKTFGFLPFFKKFSCTGEYFLDLPFTRIIYTPCNWTYEKEKSREQQRTKGEQCPS